MSLTLAVLPLLLLAAAGPAAGQLFDCQTKSQSLADGQTVFEGCTKQTCSRGSLETVFCVPVPAGCTLVSEDKSQRFPACCPTWRCGNIDLNGAGGLRPSSGNSCIHEGKTIPNGQSRQVGNCKKLDCNDGALTTHFCKDVPIGCTVTARAVGRPFPACCPRWRC